MSFQGPPEDPLIPTWMFWICSRQGLPLTASTCRLPKTVELRPPRLVHRSLLRLWNRLPQAPRMAQQHRQRRVTRFSAITLESGSMRRSPSASTRRGKRKSSHPCPFICFLDFFFPFFKSKVIPSRPACFRNPERFQSRLGNQAQYGLIGFEKALFTECSDLNQ